MDRAFARKIELSALGVSLLLIAICWDVPGCTGRRFPPIRDARAYVLEVYQVEVPGKAGRNNPDIEDVIRERRTRLLVRFPILKLTPGEVTEATDTHASKRIHVQARLHEVENNMTRFTLNTQLGDSPARRVLDSHHGLGLKDQQTAIPPIRLPLDTWGTSVAQLDPTRNTLLLLVYRLNRPSG